MEDNDRNKRQEALSMLRVILIRLQECQHEEAYEEFDQTLAAGFDWIDLLQTLQENTNEQ